MPSHYMNPNWAEASRAKQERAKQENAKQDRGSVVGGHHVRVEEKALKSEVSYEHPSQSATAQCGACVSFVSPHGCRRVAGFIRAEDWCKLFQARAKAR